VGGAKGAHRRHRSRSRTITARRAPPQTTPLQHARSLRAALLSKHRPFPSAGRADLTSCAGALITTGGTTLHSAAHAYAMAAQEARPAARRGKHRRALPDLARRTSAVVGQLGGRQSAPELSGRQGAILKLLRSCETKRYRAAWPICARWLRCKWHARCGGAGRGCPDRGGCAGVTPAPLTKLAPLTGCDSRKLAERHAAELLAVFARREPHPAPCGFRSASLSPALITRSGSGSLPVSLTSGCSLMTGVSVCRAQGRCQPVCAARLRLQAGTLEAAAPSRACS